MCRVWERGLFSAQGRQHASCRQVIPFATKSQPTPRQPKPALRRPGIGLREWLP